MRWAAALCVVSLASVGASPPTGPTGSIASFNTANDAWRRGDYIAALNGYIQLLDWTGRRRVSRGGSP